MEAFSRNISLALEGVLANKFRAFLTALGIVFGVAAVIAMMAIGKGAQQSILRQLELIGTNNIVLTAITPDQQSEAASEGQNNGSQEERKKYSPGLSLADYSSLRDVLPTLRTSSPELVIKNSITYESMSKPGICKGVNNDFFEIFNLELKEGSLFSSHHIEHGRPVCIVGSDIQKTYFQNASPIGKSIKSGHYWFTVIGVLENKNLGQSDGQSLNSENPNAQIFIPITTAIQRMENRSRIDRSDLGSRRGSGSNNYHQLDRIILKVDISDQLRSTAQIAQKIINRRHYEAADVRFEIPELLIKQKQDTQQTLNFVLAVIAGISLLVGGIGIMNIMLASVLERVREIGIRRSVGAGRKDITWQFLSEATMISLMGGVIGIILGIVAAHIIAGSAQIETVIDLWSVLVSFGVAVGIGLLFGYLPAERAAKLDPVKALRSD